MAENLASGPTLEQILWRAMDRYEERPGLVDSEEFAAHIFGIFEGDVPAETWVERFFEGDKLHAAPADVAEAIVKATRQRLHVYEFDLNRLEYVIIEDEEKVVVVSDFGQFALRNDDLVSRAIESAIVPKRPERVGQKSAEPRAVFVRSGGEVVTVDVRKVASALDQLMVKQVSMPAVDRPRARLAPVATVRRTELSETREAQVLRQDARARQAIPARISAAAAAPAAAAQATVAPATAAAAPSTASTRTAVFLVMPDGTLARPSIGSASRWQQMVSRNTATAAAVPVSGQRFAVQSGKVVALFQPRETQSPGNAGARALASAEALSAVRADSRPVRTLSDASLTQALQRGAVMVPGIARADRFWVQPSRAFQPQEPQSAPQVVGAQQKQPLQLGQITGDPWADWALTGGGETSVAAMAALRGRTRQALRAAIDRPDDSPMMSGLPALTAQLRGTSAPALELPGARAVGFRAPDGSILVNRASGPIRLAAIDRVLDDGFDLPLPGPSAPSVEPMQDLPFGLPGIAARSGALPETALSSLRFALERTAMAGGYRMPIGRLESAGDALEMGDALELEPLDPRRSNVSLAGPLSMRDGSAGQVAQLVLSMPFPNEGELHVGTDLNQALQAYLTAPVQPMPFAPDAGSILLRIRGGAQAISSPGFDAAPLDWSALHQQASAQARNAVVTLDLPDVQPALSAQSFSGLPFLLRRALGQGGDWTPGPGAPMPSSIRELAMSGSFEAQQPEMAAPARAQPRPLNPGEDEIVIPMPLWAQMGRGRLSETDQIMASPLAPSGYAPRLGAYRLVVPDGGPADLTGGADAADVVEIAGPNSLELQVRSTRGPVMTSFPAGRQIIGRVAVAAPSSDASSDSAPQASLPVAGPMELATPATATEQAAVDASSANASAAATTTPATAASAPGLTARSSTATASPAASSAIAPPVATSAARTAVPAAAPQSLTTPAIRQTPASFAPGTPTVVAATPPGRAAVTDTLASPSAGTFAEGTFKASPSGMQVPALRSALQLSTDVTARTASPSAPAVLSSDVAPSIIGQNPASASLPSVSGSDQALVTASPSIVSDASGRPIGGDTSVAAPAAPPSSGTQVAQQPSSGAAAQTFSGLAPGMWSGARPGTANYQRWSYAPGRPNVPQTSDGGVNLASLSRPVYPSLPIALRFRYAGAPLWWSAATPRIGFVAIDGEEVAPGAQALRSGLRAASSASALWRSILIANPESDGSSTIIGAGREASAGQMSSVSRRFDSLSGASLVDTGGAAAATVSGPAYIAMNGQGAAGLTTGSAAARAKADSVEMRIVAAIPPSPPPLESMSSTPQGAAAPHARGKGAQAHGQEQKDDSVSAAKIEGSVDAIAQRIYHRIRRRIESDRERFGG